MSGDAAQDPIDIEDLTQESKASFDESFPTTRERLEDIKAILRETVKEPEKRVKFLKKMEKKNNYNLKTRFGIADLWEQSWAKIVQKRRQQQRPAPDPVQAPPPNFPSTRDDVRDMERLWEHMRFTTPSLDSVRRSLQRQNHMDLRKMYPKLREQFEKGWKEILAYRAANPNWRQIENDGIIAQGEQAQQKKIAALNATKKKQKQPKAPPKKKARGAQKRKPSD